MRVCLYILFTLTAILSPGCNCSGDEQSHAPVKQLRIFHAGGVSPLLESIREDVRKDLGIELVTEASGSQVAARKVSELGRKADLLMLADNALVAKLLSEKCAWRIDFAHDAIVLGVGTRAPRISEAEEDWLPVLLDPDTRLGRVDETQGPIGYRTLLVWKLKEKQSGRTGTYEQLKHKAVKVVDHVSRLAPLLKTGEVDYGFLYRSMCIARDIRWIELDTSINLSSPDIFYDAEISFSNIASRNRETVTIQAAPVTWTLTIPREAADAETARRFVEYLLTKKAGLLKQVGFAPLAPPRFYGSRNDFAPYAGYVEYAGALDE